VLELCGDSGFFEYGRQESGQSSEVFADGGKQPIEVDGPVFVDDEVPQTDGIDHSLRQLQIQRAPSFEKVKHLAGASREAPAVLSDDVRGDVDAVLDGEVQVVRDAIRCFFGDPVRSKWARTDAALAMIRSLSTMRSGLHPGHFTSRAGRSRKAPGHDAVLQVLRMDRNAADAADAARPKGENFSA
jgi:hypothetical protein